MYSSFVQAFGVMVMLSLQLLVLPTTAEGEEKNVNQTLNTISARAKHLRTNQCIHFGSRSVAKPTHPHLDLIILSCCY